MVKGITNLYTDKDKVKMAQEKGINLSKLFDQALDQALNSNGSIDFDPNDPILLKSIDLVKENPRLFAGRVRLLNNSGINITTNQFENLIKESVKDGVQQRRRTAITKNHERGKESRSDRKASFRARKDHEKTESEDRGFRK